MKFPTEISKRRPRYLERISLRIQKFTAALANTGRRYDVLLWATFIFVLACVHAFISILGKANSDGFAIIRTARDVKKLQLFNTMVIQLSLNLLSGIAVFGSDYVRRCLLAPPKDANLNPRDDIGYQSLRAWWKTTFVRKLLWIALVVTSLPIHFLYNSIIVSTLPGYDAYAVWVDQRFFSGEPFNISAIKRTELERELGVPELWNVSRLNPWPGSAQLQKVMEHVQQSPSAWTNLPVAECYRKYGLEIYSTYRTVILVTDQTRNLTINNSALAVGALSGFPPRGSLDRSMALCPSQDPSASSDINEDLCYQDLDNTNDEENVLVQMSLSYCLSEPVGNPNAHLVWSKPITEILAAAFGVKAVAMILAWYCLRHYHGFPAGYPWSALKAKSMFGILLYTLVLMGILAFTISLTIGSMVVFPQSFSGSDPSSATDTMFILKFLAFYNSLHMIMVVREYLESNYIQAQEIFRTGKPRWSVPLPFVFFLWNLGLHQLVSAWLSTSLIDHYSIGSIADPELRSKLALIPNSELSGQIGSPTPFKNSSMSSVFLSFIPIAATGLQIVGVRVLYDLCGRRISKNDKGSPGSGGGSQRRSISLRSVSTSLQPLTGEDRSSLYSEETYLEPRPDQSSIAPSERDMGTGLYIYR